MSGSGKQKENKRAKMESEFDVKDLIVIDNGADSVKIGISGEDKPRVTRYLFPNKSILLKLILFLFIHICLGNYSISWRNA